MASKSPSSSPLGSAHADGRSQPGLGAPPEASDSGFDEDISAVDPDRPPTIEELKARRKPYAPEDHRVSDQALDWMASLPRERRLMYTMRDYPHVVNSLATRWGDGVALARYFESLLHSRRRQRAGFVPAVQDELVALAKWAHSQGLTN